MSCVKQFVARLTKHGWFDSEQESFVFRDIVDQVGNLLRVSTSNILAFMPSAVQGSVDHCIIGVQLLHQLVLEMNQSESMRSLSDHRKVASSFRDELLFDIFNLSCSLLRQVVVSDETQVRGPAACVTVVMATIVAPIGDVATQVIIFLFEV